MPRFTSPKNETVKNINEISSDFACLKVSALGKASRISGEINRITIGPSSIIANDSEKSENIENEQNSCNIKSPEKIDSQNNKISTQSGITFSVKKILLESELQRKEEVRKEIERHWQHMKENGKAIQEYMARSRSTMAEERERKSAETLATILAEEEKLAEQEEKRRKHEQLLQEQRTQEQKQKLEREVEEYRKRMKEKEDLYKKVISLRNEFGEKYWGQFQNCKDKNATATALSSYTVRLKELCHQMELIDKKIKTGELTPADLKTTELILQHTQAILALIKSEADKTDSSSEGNVPVNGQTVNQVQVKPEAIQQSVPVAVKEAPPVPEVQVAQKPEVQNTNAQSVIASPPPAVVSPTNVVTPPPIEVQQIPDPLHQQVDKEYLHVYINSQQILEEYTKSYDQYLNNPATKKFRFECQKAINIPVNAISGISEEHLTDKYTRLHNLLIGRLAPYVTQYTQGAAFCKNTLAKKIVSQGETLVSSQPKMAFPIAAVAVALWNDHPDFGDLLLAYFHTTCPFTIPLFMPKTEGQSNEEYYKSLGYKYAEDGTVEKHDKFLKRMSGIMRLYASIMVTTQRRGVNNPHPHGLQNSWRWLAAILNTEPRPMVTDLCATLILDMLEVAGNALWAIYPNQFYKLLILLSEDYYPRMQSAGCIGGGPLVRLEEFLKHSLLKGFIPPCDGQLPINFW